MRPSYVLLALAVGGTACTGAAQISSAPEAWEAEVYAAVLRTAISGPGAAPSIVVIADSTVSFDDRIAGETSDVVDIWHDFGFPALPRDLARNFRERNEKPGLLRGRVQLTGTQVRYVFASEVDGDTVLAGPSFSHYGMRPYDRVLVTFSEIGFSADGRRALVYVGLHCGGLCGSGMLLLLRRTAAGWVEMHTAPLWIS